MGEPGPLALVGGDELKPGNEPHDEILVRAAGGGPAFVLATAARERPEVAVSNAVAWFEHLGLAVTELPARRKTDVTSASNAERARSGRFFYLVGGDPGRVPKILAGSPVWDAIVAAWRDGAALALVPRVAVIPHFETFGHRWVASALSAAERPDIVLPGVDERSAAVWHGGTWQALGDGGVTVITAAGQRRFDGGSEIEGIPSPATG